MRLVTDNQNDKIKDILDDMEVYTVGRLKSQQVSLTVEELQDFIDNIREIITPTKNQENEYESDELYR